MNPLFKLIKIKNSPFWIFFLMILFSSMVLSQSSNNDKIEKQTLNSYLLENITANIVNAGEYLWAINFQKNKIDIIHALSGRTVKTIAAPTNNIIGNIVYIDTNNEVLVIFGTEHKIVKSELGNHFMPFRTTDKNIYSTNGSKLKSNNNKLEAVYHKISTPNIDTQTLKLKQHLSVNSTNWLVLENNYNLVLLNNSTDKSEEYLGYIKTPKVDKIVPFNNQVWGNSFSGLVSFKSEIDAEQTAADLEKLKTADYLINQNYHLVKKNDTFKLVKFDHNSNQHPRIDYFIEDIASVHTGRLWILAYENKESDTLGVHTYKLFQLEAGSVNSSDDAIELSEIVLENDLEGEQNNILQGHSLGLWKVNNNMVMGFTKSTLKKGNIYVFDPYQ